MRRTRLTPPYNPQSASLIHRLFYLVFALFIVSAQMMDEGTATKSPFKVKMYLIRHAETVANKENVLQGHIDFPLTEEGNGQALMLGELLSTKPWTGVYSSDLQRAQTSAQLILSKSQHWREEYGISRSNLLRELSFGLREGLPRSLSMPEVRKIKAKEMNVREHELVDTAETSESAKERQHLFLKQLYNDLKHLQHKTEQHPATTTTTIAGDGALLETGNHEHHVPRIAVISHGGFIKLFLRYYCNYHSSEKIDNCSASIITVSWLEEGNDGSYQCTIDPTQINLNPRSSDIP